MFLWVLNFNASCHHPHCISSHSQCPKPRFLPTSLCLSSRGSRSTRAWKRPQPPSTLPPHSPSLVVSTSAPNVSNDFPSAPPAPTLVPLNRAGKELPISSSPGVREVVLWLPSVAADDKAARESGSPAPSDGGGLHHCSCYGDWWRPLSPSALLSVEACSWGPTDMGTESAGEITGLLHPKNDSQSLKCSRLPRPLPSLQKYVIH